MPRRRKRLSPSKKRYMEENPTVSIVLTKKDGLKPFIDSYISEHRYSYDYHSNNYGKAVKELLLWCKHVYPKGRVCTKDDIFIPFILNHDLKHTVERVMKTIGTTKYEDGIIYLLKIANDAFNRKTIEE